MKTKRIANLQKKIKKSGADGLVITKPENRLYISGFSGSSAFLVITLEECYLITDFRYIEQAKKQSPDFRAVDYGSDLIGSLKNIMLEHNAKTFLFEEDHLTYAQYIMWQEGLDFAKLIPVKDMVEELREIKDIKEIEFLQKAAEIADQSFLHILNFIKPGQKENEVALELEYQMRCLGAHGPSFETIVASGLRSSLPHGVASDKILQIGDLIVMDFGATYRGYHSDMTRTIILGKATLKQKELYQAVLEAQQKALNAIKVGLICSDLDKIARSYLSQLGYDSYFGHSLGHGVGLAIHENPRVSTSSNTELVSGMAITIEPGVYIPGVGGVRIEDLVVVTEQGHLNLTHSTKELIELI